MTSSLRSAPLDETISKAKEMAAKLGVSRVTDTTWLDFIGIPVFASIRPDSLTLCVNAGKGVRPDEARAGAYMEAIEFAMAEHRHSKLALHTATPREVSRRVGYDLLGLCPVLETPIAADEPMMWVNAEDIRTGAVVPVPAELVFNPFPENAGQSVFGTGSNGLCSGNTLDEATVHGLCELIERDIRSFNYIRDRSLLVDIDDPVVNVARLVEKIAGAGLVAVLRHTPNEFDLPFFEGFVLEPADEAPVPIAHGCGLHLSRDIAAVRALAEAAQSRLSLIHGGRDDIIDRVRHFDTAPTETEIQTVRRTRHAVAESGSRTPYSGIASGPGADSIGSALDHLTRKLAELGFEHVLRVPLTGPESPLAVTRIIVPGLECFRPGLRRVGPRLAASIEEELCDVR